MKLIFKITGVILFMTLSSIVLGHNPVQDTVVVNKKRDFTKTIHKSFSIEAAGKVELSNRYGNVTIKNWDKPEVDIKVTIIVDSRNEGRAQEVFDRIDIDFDAGGNYVSAKTNIESKSGWSSWFSGGNNDNYKINYEVLMPKSVNLDLFNKYGNAYVDDVDGDVRLEIKYGNLTMAAIGGNLNFTLGYGNGKIGSAKVTEMDIKYSKVEIGAVADLHIMSKYSHFKIVEAHDVRVTSKYDHYTFGNIHHYRNSGKYDHVTVNSALSISAVAKYSDYQIHHLLETADFDLEYGSAKIELLDRNFKEMEVHGRYTDYRVNVQEGTEFKLDAVTRYAGIRYPDNFRIIREYDKGADKEVQGYLGNNDGAKVIRARLNYGGIKVKD